MQLWPTSLGELAWTLEERVFFCGFCWSNDDGLTYEAVGV